ncbi:hypothetical protein KC851_04555 [Candidatus Kaiserbacteria bacterium]|nr:hypothetical protein [Candidatus Kaiserbacteria bacterium]
MSIFGGKISPNRCGAIIDVGSGSVLIAIVYSNPTEDHPQIIWSHREHAPLRNIDSLERSAKAVMTALVNSSILLDTNGRKALREFNSSLKISELQCSISAPWSYTITKTINYTQTSDFLITEELLKELTNTVELKIQSELKENESLQDLGLKVITKTNMSLTANGYHIKEPLNNSAKNLTVSQGSAVSQHHLIEALDEVHDKLLPNTSNRKISFILMLYSLTREMFNQLYDVCLLDITYEATEIGIVRDGVLSYCTHIPFGSFSLAREISEITKIPLHEAFANLHTENPYQFLDNLSAKQKQEVETMFENYTNELAQLFHETGDNLSIPRTISVHSDLSSEPIFIDIIKKAAKRAVKTDVNVTSITSEIIKKMYAKQTEDTDRKIPRDTALLLSAQFFHNQQQHQLYKHF